MGGGSSSKYGSTVGAFLKKLLAPLNGQAEEDDAESSAVTSPINNGIDVDLDIEVLVFCND